MAGPLEGVKVVELGVWVAGLLRVESSPTGEPRS